MQELAKTYSPELVEGRIYDLWLENKAFEPKIDPNQKPFVIAIPPPNVTGSLHMGHALNNTIQDILIRRSRMKGVPTLWIPGTDHAGIATQNVVEKKLVKEGKNRKELGRDEFEKQVWQWVDEYGHIIIDQLKKLGCSCDWSRQRFTMDKDYAEAVKTAFLHYHKKGWIYEGERVINWCVRCQTALSDIEVEHPEQPAKLYYFKYDKNFPITIATTRPETKLGDTAVAVNPDDERYAQYINQTFEVNFAGIKRKIKIIADQSIDPKFGTGAVGVTPAHSLIDAELAEKHNLPSITVIDQFGLVTPQGLGLAGSKTKEARIKILEWLKQENLLEKEEDITHNLSVCYRCSREIEPQPSKQWFLKMSELTKPAIEAVKKGEIKFTPKRWEKVYLDWMENLKDWCISRQIWWGHRLPVFTKPKAISNDQFLISNQIPNPNDQKIIENSNIENSLKIENCKIENLEENKNEEVYVGDNPPEDYKQTDDVLDTWFSSALWPFATLGWPKETEDLKYFYPTTILSTARDIIYLWVARMIFSGLEFTGEKPFSQVYIHPTVFNVEGKRMSKSLGTGVDPLALIEKYGADATRFGLTYINTGIQDIKFDENAILASQKFANKVWNISRFIIMQAEGSPRVSGGRASASRLEVALQSTEVERVPETSGTTQGLQPKPKTDADKKILDSLNRLITNVNTDLDNFRFGQAAHSLYDFIWHDFADIYIEESKKQMDENTQQILFFVLRTSLLLLHPFMPFLTEEIWQILKENQLVEEKLLINASWPEDKSKIQNKNDKSNPND